MAILNFAFNATGGMVAGTTDSQVALTTAVSDAVDTAATANAAAGAKADVTTELAAIDTAIAALIANQTTGDGAVVLSIDTALITTKNQLRTVLEKAARQLTESMNLLT